MTLTAAAISIVQENKQGVAVTVSVSGLIDTDYSMYVKFHDMKTGNQFSQIGDRVTVPAVIWNGIAADSSGVRVKSFTMSESVYTEYIEKGLLVAGDEFQVQVQIQTSLHDIVSTSISNLPYYQPIDFGIYNVATSFNSLIVDLSGINDTVYDQNNTSANPLEAWVTLSRRIGSTVTLAGSITKIYSIDKNGDGTATINMDDLSGAGLDPVKGEYEINVQVTNAIVSSHQSLAISITNEIGTVTSNNFKTFDPSGSKFTLEYDASKSYIGYENVKVYASFNDAGRHLVGGDSSGTVFENNKPTTYILDENVKILLPKYDESKGSDSTKFKATFWIEAQEVGKTFIHDGNKSSSEYWLDTELALPTVTLQSVDFGSGVQTIYVVADGSFNADLAPKVVYDLSGVAADPLTSVMTISGEDLAFNTKTYTYTELVAAVGYLKVTASRREVNNQDGDYTNIAHVQTLNHLLSPIKREDPPAANFTITAGPNGTDGTVSVVFTDSILSITTVTDLLATLNLDGVEQTESGDIVTDASNTQFDFDNIVSGKTYTAKAYSRFNISSLAPRYREINGSDPLLLSKVKQDATLFTTSPPTMTMYVLPTGDTNDLTTLRMDGEANANKIKNLQVWVLHNEGRIGNQELLIDASGTETTGGEELRSDYDADDLSYNAGFSQDFSFNNVIDVDADGKMFVLGIIDTPNQVDAIQTDISATNELLALRNAINTYNADIIVYEAAYDLSANPNGDDQYSDASAAYIAWGASMETLSGELVSVTDLLVGTALGSLAHLNAAISDNSGALLLETAAAATRAAAGLAFTAWTNQYAIASANTDPTKIEMEQGNFTYDKTTVSGEQLVMSEFDASAVSQLNVGVLLTDTITALTNANNMVGTDEVDGKSDDLQESLAAYNDAIAIKQGLGGDTGSVAHALDQRDKQESIRDNRYAALLGLATDARVALVGKDGNDVEGDAQAPLGTGSILVMNDARTALGAIVKGVIAAFAVPALKGTSGYSPQ